MEYEAFRKTYAKKAHLRESFSNSHKRCWQCQQFYMLNSCLLNEH